MSHRATAIARFENSFLKALERRLASFVVLCMAHTNPIMSTWSLSLFPLERSPHMLFHLDFLHNEHTSKQGIEARFDNVKAELKTT